MTSSWAEAAELTVSQGAATPVFCEVGAVGLDAPSTESAENTTTTPTTALPATSPSGPSFARIPSQDLDTLSASGNTWPEGIWSDGVTMWVADYQDDKIYAYNMGSKEWDEGRDFNTLNGAGNNHPSGLWSDGTTMWVVDHEDVMVYAYDMATKAHDQAKDFSNLRGVGQRHPEGIWSDGTTVWISDGWHQGAKIYAYNLRTKGKGTRERYRRPCISREPLHPRPLVEWNYNLGRGTCR